MPSQSLKLVAALFSLHWILLLLLRLNQGLNAYAIGQLTGKLFFTGLVVYAVLRLVKYGWGVSLFILAGTLLSESRPFLETMHGVAPGESVEGVWLLFLVVNLPTLAALVLLLPDSSRAPFRAARAAEKAAPTAV